ncbi:MAG: tyrosine-type recombinase/integrase [Calditrichaeota bacterium]|nr:tyrosine-type recombinase/integrase [Calditrichota bacterium]
MINGQTVSKEHFFSHVDDFMDYRKTIYEVSDQTIKSNHIDINLFRDFLDMENYFYIDGHAVMNFQYYLKQQRLNCGASINRKIFTLRSYSKYLKLEQVPYVDTLPFYDVLKCRLGYKSRANALSKEQVKSIFQSIERDSCLSVRDYAVYALMYKLGLRIGEVHKLNLENIDFDSRKITVLGKGNKRRTLYLDDEMIAILMHWVAVRKQFLNYDISNALFISKKGNRLAIRTIEDNFKKIIKKLKLTVPFNVTCHTLRHSFASHLNDEQVDILVIQDLLGHATPRTTADYYIHPSEKKVREALEKLPGVIYMNQLVQSGLLKFQSAYKKRE